jgi:hypothetical protein
MGRCSKWNLLPNGSVGIAIWQRLLLHRFPASEGLPGFLSWRAIARRIWSQLSAMVCRSRPWKPSPANWIFPPRKSGCSAGSLRRRFRGKERSAQSTPSRHGQGAHRHPPHFRFGWSLPALGRPGREAPLPRSPVMKHYWRHWLGWASSRPHGLAPVVYSAARACIPHTNTDS